jgi:hypothetical protein
VLFAKVELTITGDAEIDAMAPPLLSVAVVLLP